MMAAGIATEMSAIKPVYFGHLGSQNNCLDYRGVLISQVYLYALIHIYIAMGPQLTVLIIEVSLFQSVHNSRFDCTCTVHVHVQYMYSTCTVHVQYMYSTCTVHVLYMYCTCTVHVQYMYSSSIVS